MVSKVGRRFALLEGVKTKNPPPDSLLAVGLETLATCLAVSPFAGSAGSLNRGRNNSSRRHGDGRRAALRVGERQHALVKLTQA